MMGNESTPLLPGLSYAAAAARASGDRRRISRDAPWYVVHVGGHPSPVFLAAHRHTGRSYRLPVDNRSAADAQVEMLNRASLSLEA
jgi:hypothetical protein